MNPLDLLREQFNGHVLLKEKRPGIQQLYAPIFHEDGDMMSIFLDLSKDTNVEPKQSIRISDYGLTRMRLSYSFDIDSENKERIYDRILLENGVTDDDGAMVLETTAESLYPAILQFAQAVGKVSNLRLFKREVLASFFDEMLSEFILGVLAKFKPVEHIFPLPDNDEYEVDWQFQSNGVPTYLFTVKDAAKARLAALSCREFQHRSLRFHSMVVHEHFDRLGRKDCARLTNACDKQFTSLDEFKGNVLGYLARQQPEAQPQAVVNPSPPSTASAPGVSELPRRGGAALIVPEFDDEPDLPSPRRLGNPFIPPEIDDDPDSPSEE